MKFQTSITNIKDGEEIIRGHKLEELIQERSFVEVIYLLFQGELPSESHATMLNALLVAAIDHGPAVTSAMNARISASAGNSTHSALAAGVLGFGPRHGIAGEGAMRFFKEQVTMSNEQPNYDLSSVLQDLKDKGVRIPGYGHKVFIDTDPRSDVLFGIAKEIGIFGQYSEFALQVKEELNKISSKPLPLNIDGTMAAILCDMGMDARLGQTFFLISRTPGLLAQIHEEQTNDVGSRRLEDSEIEFV
jgi:citrate synthase